tara:strand:- start:7 stop:510 length:504 start_codon:yes stop_codon:yes gene_type:complete
MARATKKYPLGRGLSFLLLSPEEQSLKYQQLEEELYYIKQENYKLISENESLKKDNQNLEYNILEKQRHIENLVDKIYRKANKKNNEKNPKTYLIKNNHTKLYKIGYSKNPKHRERTLQSQEPNIKMVKIWDKNIEKKLHKLYSEYRVRGEWFNLTPIQVKYICTKF